MLKNYCILYLIPRKQGGSRGSRGDLSISIMHTYNCIYRERDIEKREIEQAMMHVFDVCAWKRTRGVCVCVHAYVVTAHPDVPQC